MYCKVENLVDRKFTFIENTRTQKCSCCLRKNPEKADNTRQTIKFELWIKISFFSQFAKSTLVIYIYFRNFSFIENLTFLYPELRSCVHFKKDGVLKTIRILKSKRNGPPPPPPPRDEKWKAKAPVIRKRDTRFISICPVCVSAD
jgi:hypothetical protein